MPTLQEQYTEVTRQSQDAVVGAIDAWSRAMQEALGNWPMLPGYPDYTKLIDQMYDIASTVIDAQRSLTTSLLSTSASYAETMREQAASTTHEATETAKAAAKKAEV